jgi:uncharacterized protein YpuA (DUF1002 family)
MRISCQSIARFFAVILSMFAVQAFAQESPTAKNADNKVPATSVTPTAVATKNTTAENTTSVKSVGVKTAMAKAQPAKKMVQDATINLQTTITGNQEQPRVLYILPWQSPQTANVDFESIDSQQKTVFSHVEREELRRELESAGEL